VIINNATPSEPPAPPIPPAPRPWECAACHHVIGHIERRGGVDRLIVRRGPYCDELLGTANIACSECGHMNEWHLSSELLTALMTQRGRLRRLCEAG
jgi:hypothetical protein